MDKSEELSVTSFPALPESNMDFLDDYAAEFTLTGPKKNVDELVHQLQKNAVKLIELEQAYRVARLQTAQKKRIRPKRNKTAATKSQDHSVPISKKDHKRDETVATEAELDEVDSFLHQNVTGVNKKPLDSGVLSPAELLAIKDPPNSDVTSREMNERTESSLQKLSMGYESGTRQTTVQATATTIPKKQLKQSVNTTKVKSTAQLAERDEIKHSIHPKVDRDTSTTSVTTHGTKLTNEPSVSVLASESMFTGNTFSVKPSSDPMTTELDKSRLISDKKTVIHKGIVKEPVPKVQPHLMNICGTPILHPSRLYLTCVAECDTNVLGSRSEHTIPKPATRCSLESVREPEREVELVRTPLTEPVEDLLTDYTPNAGPLVRHATDIPETTQPRPSQTITSAIEANAIAKDGKPETQSGAVQVLQIDLAEKEMNGKYRRGNVAKSDLDFRAQHDLPTTTVEAENAKASTGTLNPTHTNVEFIVRKPTGQILPTHILPTMSSLDTNELKVQDSKVTQHTTLIRSIIDQDSKDHTELRKVVERMLDGTVDGQYTKPDSAQDTVVSNVTTEPMDISINKSPSKLPTFTHVAQEDKQDMAGSVTIEATTHRRDQALVENTRTETQRVSSSNVLGSPYEELDSPLKQISGHTNIKSVSKRSTMNEKNKKEARKYRSSAQKTILLSVMTSEQINSDTAMQNNPDDNFVKNAIPERLKKSVAQHIPYRRSLDSRTNGEILESNVIRDVRSSSLQEPTMHPVRSIHRRTASRESPVSEELNQQGFTVTDPSCQSVWQYEKPAGDLVETQDTPNADKTAIRAEKPSRLLAISKLTFSRQLSEYTIDTDENSA
ncbi:hypothetical protein AHF37_00035 [Paragonimus kellicotti]|nr:hypothetical protein AHF37_00035 [Paragonimus kellicotti]